ncbi:MAG: sarcosine oxidase subunit alpha, partial [Alcaligenaceae bacterium]|nr:sarcosine oxidase subunit alpha [Alcaligenaceae bacterium]
PFMACAELSICQGVRARLFRISFSGELAYELAVPARYGDSLMRVLMEAGREFDVTPYGTEALGVLRIEKGHAAGPELNGQTSGIHLGLGRMVSRKKDSIGAVMSRRPALEDAAGHRMTGLLPVDGQSAIPAGAHLFEEDAAHDMKNDLGWVSSAAWSPHIGGPIALAFLKGGDQRLGDTLRAVSPLDGVNIQVRVVSPVFIDPEGERLRV